MFPHEPILVTLEEYHAIGFALFIFGMFLTMKIWFDMPDEKEEDDEEFYY